MCIAIVGLRRSSVAGDNSPEYENVLHRFRGPRQTRAADGWKMYGAVVAYSRTRQSQASAARDSRKTRGTEVYLKASKHNRARLTIFVGRERLSRASEAVPYIVIFRLLSPATHNSRRLLRAATFAMH